MKHILASGALAILAAGFGVLGFPATTQAGGAYCSPEWRPEHPSGNCSSQIAISPGNDSRVNLFLLMQDRTGANGAGLEYPDNGWRGFYGRNFLRWNTLRAAWYPQPARTDWPDHSGTRCQTVESGGRAFASALRAANGLRDSETELLGQLRGKLADVCDTNEMVFGEDGDGTDEIFSRKNPAEFYAYLQASSSFYRGEWDRADRIYRRLATLARDPWVKETAQYMVARNHLNHAIESGVSRWGDLERDSVNNGQAASAEAGFKGYLGLHPEGLYAASAKGLIRKSLWLQRDHAGLAPIYADLLNDSDPASPDAADLVSEVDSKLLTADFGDAELGPYLRAAHILMEMRVWDDLTAEELSERSATLETHAAVFEGHPDLYSFLQANHAFYATKDYRAVLRLLPDAAREESYAPLAFSRQYLRGLALHALGDRNEEGFWLDLIEGSNGIWQRPAVELPLARLYEQQGRLGKVFAQGSPITDQRMRRMLLGYSAGPDILKAQMRDENLGESERGFALFAGLLKQLRHGEYDGFLEDFPLTEQSAGGDKDRGFWDLMEAEEAPLAYFTDGEWSDGYACPPLVQTVQALAANPRARKAQICLGDFYRINGFDDFDFEKGGYQNPDGDDRPPPLATRDYYPGKAIPRHDFYTAIMADRRASSDDKAYALFRAIRCYAPTGSNSCGGPGVEEDVRASWFRRLKGNHPGSQWAQELKYYW